MIKPFYFGTAKGGVIKMDDEPAYIAHVKTLDGKVRVLVEKNFQNRTVSQNAYYWKGVLETLAEEVGYTKVEWHKILSSMFLSEEVPVVGKRITATQKHLDGVKTYTRSTSDLTTKEFGEYIEQICHFAASELNIYIPPAEAVSFE